MATPEQIKDWKDKYKDVFKVSVGEKSCFLKKPSRKTLSYASTIATKDPLRFNEILLNDCWLGGDEEIKTDDSLFLSVSAKLSEIIETQEAELVKL